VAKYCQRPFITIGMKAILFIEGCSSSWWCGLRNLICGKPTSWRLYPLLHIWQWVFPYLHDIYYSIL